MPCGKSMEVDRLARSLCRGDAMTHAAQPLRVPFGHASAAEFNDEATCGEFLARLPDAPSRFGAIGPAADFRIRLCNVALPGVSIVAGAGTAKATGHLGRRLSLVIPFGRCETVLRAGRERFKWASPHHAFFIPAGQRIEAESTSGAFLRLDIVPETLQWTAAGMVGIRNQRLADLALGRPRIVPMQVQGVDWLAAIRALCGTIDALDCDAVRLKAAGLDDTLLRTVVMMLHPDQFIEKRLVERAPRRLDLDPLLEQIVVHLGGRVTLADMEHWSGRTARAIQIAFQKRFGIGPMRWVRNQRLDLVRARLLAASAGATVAEIAAVCGMPRMATLIPEYTKRFGELPSETLLRRRSTDSR